MDILYIVIPAYNEAANIISVINDWYPIVEAHSGGGLSRLLVIDDGSKDNTFFLAKREAEKRPLLLPITKSNSGHGSTVLYGYRYAIDNGADFIFQTDSDGQTVPEEFESFWQKRNEKDMIIGWRRDRQDGFSRLIVTKVLKCVIRLCFHVNVCDANTPFRLMNTETLGKYIHLIPDDFNLSNVLISVVYEKMGLDVEYIPITFRPRQGGLNSINLRKIFRIGLQALKDFRTIDKTISACPR